MHSYFQGNLISGQAAEPESDGSWRLGWGAPWPHARGAGRLNTGLWGGVSPPRIAGGSAGLDSNPASRLCSKSSGRLDPHGALSVGLFPSVSNY